LFPTWSG